MRPKRESVLQFAWPREADRSELKIVAEHREKYKRMSEILDRNPEILDLADRDLQALSRGGRDGRRAGYTSENLLRALIVHTVEGGSFRRTIVRLAESEFLQDFVRLGNRRPMDFTFLERAFKAISPETWKAINEALAGYGEAVKAFDPSAVRADTTVVETPIHYPTDASLLWDGWRALARRLRAGRALAPWLCPHRFHDRKAKKLSLRIGRYAGSRTAARRRAVKGWYGELIGKVRWIAGAGERFCAGAERRGDAAVRRVAREIEELLPLVRTIASTAERANVKGERVSASERVFSVFEPHTELICRGKRGKPVEFGHVVLLAQARGKFISHYEVMEHREADSRLAGRCIENHERMFGEAPDALTADTGFNPKAEERRGLEGRVKTLAIPRRVADWGRTIEAAWQRFRAGIEGSISVLKRAYRLLRCPYRGFKSFAASVGLSVFCHNLALLARPPDG